MHVYFLYLLQALLFLTSVLGFPCHKGSRIPYYEIKMIVYSFFQDYIRDPDRRFAADTIAAIGICMQRLPKMANTCLEGLLALTKQGLLVLRTKNMYF